MIKHKYHAIRNKYNAVKTQRDGMNFDSKAEARYYDDLLILKRSGVVVFFLRQVPFDLPGKVKYRCDFQVFYLDGHVEFIDVKGYITPSFKRNKKMVEQLYPVEIIIVK